MATIAENLTKLSVSLEAAYKAISRMGGNVPEKHCASNLADAIKSILSKYDEILHFTALEDGGVGISLNKSGSPDPISLECKVNNEEWSSWDLSEVQLQKDDVLYVRAVDENKTFSKDYSNRYCFSMSGGKVAAGGSIQHLLKKDGDIDSVPEWGFYGLFLGCSNLVQAPELPATTLADYCYDSMFYNCSNLTQAPELPATTLASYCYDSMFRNCNKISEVHMPASMDGVYSTSTHGDTTKTVVYDL